MFKKVLLLFCLALSFITFSCSKDKEPAFGKLSQTIWEGKLEEYEVGELSATCHATLTFTSKKTVDYVIYHSYSQEKHTYNYSVDNNVIKIGDIDYYILHASNYEMVLQGFTDKYKHVLHLEKKK